MCQFKLLSNRALNNDLEKKNNYNLKAQKNNFKKNVPKNIQTSQAKNHNIPLQFSSIQAKLKITAKIVCIFYVECGHFRLLCGRFRP